MKNIFIPLRLKAHQSVPITIFFVITGLYLTVHLKYPLLYLFLTYEDLAGEWGQFFLFSTVIFFSARLALAKTEFRPFFAVLAFASFYVAGEEISWGQRLLDITTPPFFQKYNLQKEINLHNFFTGHEDTSFKRVAEALLAAGLISYGLLYPLTIKLSLKASRWIYRKGVPAPPLHTSPFFALAAVLEPSPFNFNEAEIAELMIAFGLAIFSLQYWFCYKNNLHILEPREWKKSHSHRLGVKILTILGAAVIFSAGMTYASLSLPHLKPQTEKRVYKGLIKFALRYKRSEKWEQAAQLYLKAYEKRPDKMSNLREAAECYRAVGKMKKFFSINRMAITYDLKLLERSNESVPLMLSLVESYAQAGEQRESRTYLKKAFQIASSTVKQYPNDPRATYWLAMAYRLMEGNEPEAAYWQGRTYQLTGDIKSATELFNKAYELKPASLIKQSLSPGK